MSQTEYYREQAAAARNLAEKSELPNVRERYLASYAVWMRFAEQAERLDEMQAAGAAAGWA